MSENKWEPTIDLVVRENLSWEAAVNLKEKRCVGVNQIENWVL
jgi:hypothetical protein